MFEFSVFLLGLCLVHGIQLGEHSGLNFDVNQEYATSYEDYKPSDYKFGYGVSDPHTGDHKSHWEVKENGVVRGEYRLLEPDGTTRIVQYTADDHNGFRATVKKIGHAVHPVSVHRPQETYNNPIVPETHHNYNPANYFKTYDGSIGNYVDSIPTLIPYHEADTLQNHQIPVISNNVYSTEVQLPYTGKDGVSKIQALKTSRDESQSVPNHSTLLELDPGHISPIGPIRMEEYISGHIGQPVYTSVNIPVHYSEGMFQPLRIREPVNSPSLINENNEHLFLPIHVQNGMGFEGQNYMIEDSHSPVGDSLSHGIRIEHPHGESSSSSHSKTGNIEDDTAYTTHGDGRVILGW